MAYAGVGALTEVVRIRVGVVEAVTRVGLIEAMTCVGLVEAGTHVRLVEAGTHVEGVEAVTCVDVEVVEEESHWEVVEAVTRVEGGEELADVVKTCEVVEEKKIPALFASFSDPVSPAAVSAVPTDWSAIAPFEVCPQE